ncbi:MAG: PilT/PilU family type 4a pilus ATPase [Candidatus Aminicenantes bacterium]|nr:MAG: PilT/PilU family type 4a pilus ATPase [Candidatus Aminicenantes bacterium]
MLKSNLNTILTFAAQKEVSDVHFQVGVPPMVRHNGQLISLKHPPLTEEDTCLLGRILTKIEDEEKFRKEIKEYDGSFSLPGVARFRANVFRQNNKYAAVLRVIPYKIRSFSELNLPPIIEQISTINRGLILVTGATGNGKSTTLASMLGYINKTKRNHIVTIEDPIEFIFENDLSIISQREVGPDTDSFARALRSALRQDPDIIMVGELRDLETVDTCLKAAETGHVVMASIHTPDVMRTLGRLLSYFPPEEQITVRQRISENLMAIISLRLLINIERNGLIPACEVMLANKTIEMCIKSPEKTAEIPKYMSKSKDLGMQTFDQHLIDLVKAKKISMEEAMVAAEEAEQLERDLTLEM